MQKCSPRKALSSLSKRKLSYPEKKVMQMIINKGISNTGNVWVSLGYFLVKAEQHLTWSVGTKFLNKNYFVKIKKNHFYKNYGVFHTVTSTYI